jgi:hypothetical protein
VTEENKEKNSFLVSPLIQNRIPWLILPNHDLLLPQGLKCAAVQMVNHPPFFKSFAATIRHTPLDATRSKITYTYLFEATPRWLAWLLEPVMNFKLKRETQKRLGALKSFLERG